MQFKKRIYDEELGENQRKLVMSSQSSWQINDHFLRIPADCPLSAIVYDQDNSYREMATALFLKYVKEESDYEINVDWNTRNDLQNMIDAERRESDEKEIDDIDSFNLEL